jgi:transposase
MARQKRQDGLIDISLFKNGKYFYAGYQETIRKDNGKYLHPRTDIGRVDVENGYYFKPSSRFFQFTKEEVNKFVFPLNWDLSKIESYLNSSKKTYDVYDGPERNYLYGHTMLLSAISKKLFLESDMIKVFGERRTQKILTCAFYLLIINKCYNHLYNSQEIIWFPYQSGFLDDRMITELMKSISESEILEFLKLRIAHFKNDSNNWLLVDSTSYSIYGSYLADKKWGHNKENDIIPQVNHMVVYDVATRLPVYYRKLPGNIPDSRTLITLIQDLEYLQIVKPAFICDRGYLSEDNEETLVKKGYPFILACKTKKKVAKTAIDNNSEELMVQPQNWIPEQQTYGIHERDVDYSVTVKNEKRKADGVSLFLYFNNTHKGIMKDSVANKIYESEVIIKNMIASKDSIDADTEALLSTYHELDIENVKSKRRLVGYTLNKTKVEKIMKNVGYFALLCNKMKKKTAAEVIDMYSFRDWQEKGFGVIKTSLGGRRIRTGMEQSSNGRFFTQFIALTLSTYIKSEIKNSELDKKYPTIEELLGSLASIRLEKRVGKHDIITPFNGVQIDIFNALGVEIPEECLSKAKPIRKKVPL